jgi:choline dehydrogenase
VTVDDYDYIVVGSGSAGCVLADRLSADGQASVLVLEAGEHDRRLWINMPIGYGKTFYDQRVNWKFEAQPDAGLNHRQIYFPRGRVVGGSSSINAMVYCRGLPQDFDDWAALGNPGWAWRDVQPVYEGFERRVDAEGRASPSGQLFVSDVRRQLHPMEKFFFDGAQQAGLPFTEDFNGPAPEGVGRYQINTRHGMRWSAADAFLRPALRRGRVRLMTGARVSRVLFEGRQATGVSYRQGGVERQARARRAVVLSAGAVQSPQLLQLSGVGPAELLRTHGIPVLHANPSVGGNLQDHLAMSYYYKATQPTLNNVLGNWWGQLRVGLQYISTLGGPLSISVNQCGGFVRSHPGAERHQTGKVGDTGGQRRLGPERDAGGKQTLDHGPSARHPQAAIVHPRPGTLFSPVQFVLGRVKDHTRNDFALVFQTDGNRPMRQAVQKVGCAVQRIDDPATGGVGPLTAAGFLAQPAIGRAARHQLFLDDALGFQVGP